MKKKKKNINNVEFKREYIKMMLDYFDIPSNFLEKNETATKVSYQEFASNLPTIQGFCAKIKIDRETFYYWLAQAENDDYKSPLKEDLKEFLITYKKCREMQESIWIENSLKGLYSTSFATFVGKNIFGWKDKSELLQKNIGDAEEAKKNLYKKVAKKIDKMSREEIDNVILEVLK